MNESRIIEFYRGNTPDSQGRTIDEILSFDLEQLEHVHDFIQWLFPLTEPSQVNPDAPILSAQDIETFRGNEVLKRSLLDAFAKILALYGLELQDRKVVRSPAWDERTGWLTPHNHNYLRITRILTSLRLLGLEEYAEAFYVALGNVYKEYAMYIGPKTWRFWTDAVRHGSLLPLELTVIDYYGRESRIVVGKLPVIVGRDEQADVQIKDPWASHQHCELVQAGDAVVVRDLDSRNGIFMHGHRISEATILSGERFTIGRTELIVRYGGKGQRATDDASTPQDHKPSLDETRELF